VIRRTLFRTDTEFEIFEKEELVEKITSFFLLFLFGEEKCIGEEEKIIIRTAFISNEDFK